MIVTKRYASCHSGIIIRAHFHKLDLKAKNVLAVFASLLRLFQRMNQF